MIRWEYRAPYIQGGLEALMTELATLGEDGWEAIQIGKPLPDGQRVFLKRLLRPPDPPLLLPEGYDPRPGAISRVS